MDPLPVPDLPPMTTPHDHPSPPPTTPHDHPSPPMTTGHGHPPYAEMILAAITALNDKDGSSKQAISNYIHNQFTNLPPTHSILLSHHLKRLRNLGQLVMEKFSYKLPSTSGEFQPPESTDYHPALDFSDGDDARDGDDLRDVNFDAVGFNLENSSARKRGRPPKPKPVPELGFQNLENSSKRKRGRPRKVNPLPELGFQNEMMDVEEGSAYVQSNQFEFNGGVGYGGSETVLAALGLSDDGVEPVLPETETENTPVVVKRGRGRPPKSAGGSGGRVVGSGGGDGEIHDHVAGSGDGEIQGAEGVEKPQGTSVMMDGPDGNGVRVKRGRGRPRKFRIGPMAVPLSGNLLRPRGRPRKVNGGARPSVAVNGGASERVFGERRSSRPSRNMSTNLKGKQSGSPDKGGLGNAVIVTDPQQLGVYQQLKSKYELLQSKVKRVASMVKPSIDPEYGSTALRALQELDDLAGEANAPPLYLQN